MRLGYGIGYWSSGPPPGTAEAVQEAERLGFDSLWTAEAYGSDALTPLAWWGSQTSRMRLGSGICQMPARTPTATAMAAMTLDHLSDGRFILGLGASGPQVVEGWYGQPYPKPLARTREYVDIVRKTIRREQPVTFAGDHYTLPHEGGTGLGKALKSTIHPRRGDLPIFLGAEGPKNVALAAEIADGWVAMLVSPHDDAWYRERLAEGFARRAPDLRPASEFEVVCMVPVVINPDVEAAANVVRPHLALYAGGMGAKGANFHFDAIARAGFEAEADRIQELYLAGNKAEAIASIPVKMVEAFALVGPPEKIRDDLEAWKETVVTTVLVSGPVPLLRAVAELVL
ncbi:MAG TPA: LLM class F420-dependent oxidoreductase [Acidimicrobiia bacterium]